MNEWGGLVLVLVFVCVCVCVCALEPAVRGLVDVSCLPPSPSRFLVFFCVVDMGSCGLGELDFSVQ